MTQVANKNLDWLIITTDFLSGNIGWIVLIVFLFICREAISNLLNRITSFSWSSGDSQVGLNASPPHELSTIELPIEKTLKNDLKTEEHPEDKSIAENSNDWFSNVYDLLEQGEYEAATKVFKTYEIDEQDQNKLYMEKSIFIRLLFHKANDRNAIPLLLKHIQESKTEEQKYDALTWLSLCYRDSKQFDKDIDLWLNQLNTFESIKFNTDVHLHLARAYRDTNNAQKAREVLVGQLAIVEDDIQKSKIYSELAQTEEALGNSDLSCYCKDKAVEADPNDLDELFNAAFSASKRGRTELAINNYTLLTNMNPKNAAAWNNLGVVLKDVGLKSKAIESYIKAAALGETLALANQGFALLEAGFVDEAEKLAKKALESNDIHENVHKLSSRIADERNKESEHWKDVQKKSSKIQSMLRLYTDKYYLGDSNKFSGKWSVGEQNVEILRDDKKIEFHWESLDGNNQKKHSIKGSITGESFQGKYKIASENKPLKSVLSTLGDFEIECLGYIREDRLSIFSLDSKRDISVELQKHS